MWNFGEYIKFHLFYFKEKMVKFEKQVESFAATQELDLEEDADEEYPTVARWVISRFWLRDRGTLGVGWSVCVCPVWLATISYCIEN